MVQNVWIFDDDTVIMISCRRLKSLQNSKQCLQKEVQIF